MVNVSKGLNLKCAFIFFEDIELSKERKQVLVNFRELFYIFVYMITIKDISEQAKVSTGTVDRVLHNRGGVSKRTEERIRKILKENNFKINTIARTLAIRKKFNLATLIPDFDSDNLFWRSPYMGILKAKDEVENYGVQVSNYSFDQLKPSTYLKQFGALLESEPDAVILVPTFYNETKDIVEQLDKRNIPYIFLNVDIDGFNNLSFIGQDSYESGYLAGKLMHLCLGKDCVFLTVQTRVNVNNYQAISKRIKGFNAYFNTNEIAVKSLELNFNSLKNISKLKKEIGNFLEANKDVKGIFVPSSTISIIANSIEKDKIETLSLIGFDTTEQNIKCLKEDKITFLISQKSFNQGYYSVQVMVDYLIQKKNPQPKILSPIEIITKENVEYSQRNKWTYNEEKSLV